LECRHFRTASLSQVPTKQIRNRQVVANNAATADGQSQHYPT
jgi:hypothetical protein